ncbi:hypothetical protein GW765_01260 [Candidatus Parcubacteria bacterium]|nr:hypothetical protein [Candidatus Parcubacteria bacterium]
MKAKHIVTAILATTLFVFIVTNLIFMAKGGSIKHFDPVISGIFSGIAMISTAIGIGISGIWAKKDFYLENLVVKEGWTKEYLVRNKTQINILAVVVDTKYRGGYLVLFREADKRNDSEITFFECNYSHPYTKMIDKRAVLVFNEEGMIVPKEISKE